MSKEKQIEFEMAEMLEIIAKAREEYANDITDHTENEYIREGLLNAGYRKQSEGEWQIKSEIHQMLDDVDEELYVECPLCKRTFWVPYEFDDEKIFEYAREHYPYCNCGAKMKGGAE